MLPNNQPIRVCEAQRVMVSNAEWYRLLHAQDLGHAADFLRFFAVPEPMFEDTDRPTHELMAKMYEAFSEWWYRGMRLGARMSFLEQANHHARVVSAGYPASPQEFTDWQSIVSRHCADPDKRAENVRHPVWTDFVQSVEVVQRFSIAPRVGVMESLASQQAGLDDIRMRAYIQPFAIPAVAFQNLNAGQVITPDMIEVVPDWQPVADAPAHIEPRTRKVIRRTMTHTVASRKPASAGIPVEFPVKVKR